MNLFKSFKATSAVDGAMANGHDPDTSENGLSQTAHETQKSQPDIPEKIFIESEKPIAKTTSEPPDEKQEQNNLEALYRYLERNLESKGYEHALMNPDSSLMEEHVQFINNEVHLMISKVKTYYSSYMRIIEFHLETRRRNGMIETVEELMMQKDTILDEIKIVGTIEEDAQNGKGASQNLILSYKKGFRNGMAAITYGTVFGKRN